MRFAGAFLAFIVLVFKPAFASESDVRDFIANLKGKQAIVHLKRVYYGGAVFGWERNHYLLISHLEKHGIVSETFQEKHQKEIEKNDSCKNATGLCIQLRDHSNDGRREYELDPTLHSSSLHKMSDEYLSLKLGIYDVLRVVRVQTKNDPSCEWEARVRAWFKNETPAYEQIRSFTGLDGYVHDLCFYYGRSGLTWKYNTMVFN